MLGYKYKQTTQYVEFYTLLFKYRSLMFTKLIWQNARGFGSFFFTFPMIYACEKVIKLPVLFKPTRHSEK